MSLIREIKKILSLSLSLAKTQFKLRNEGSYLGIFWYLLDPLAMFLIILGLSGVLANNNVKNFPVYLLLGLIMFNFFRQTTISSTNAIAANAGFIKSMKISSESFVVSSAMQSFFSHLFELAVLLAFMIFFKMPLIGFFWYPLIFLFLFLFSTGVSFFLASAGVYVNDLNNVWSVFVNLLWFSTPIFYVITAGSETIINKLNPMFYFVNTARDLMLSNSAFPTGNFFGIVLLSVVFFLAGIIFFEKFKKKFAELL